MVDLGLPLPFVGISTRPNRKPSGPICTCGPKGVIQIPSKRCGFTVELLGVQPPLGFEVADPAGENFPRDLRLATPRHFGPNQRAFKVQPRQGQRFGLNVPTSGRPRSVQGRGVQFHWEFHGGKVATDEGPFERVEVDAYCIARQSSAPTLAHGHFGVVESSNADFCPIHLMKVDPLKGACPKGFPIEFRVRVDGATFIRGVACLRDVEGAKVNAVDMQHAFRP